MYPETDLLFPARLIPSLAELRGAEWRRLVQRVAALPEHHVETIALMLLVTRLTECPSCEQGSFRAWQGCAVCSGQAVQRFRGSDAQLLQMHRQAQEEVERFLGQPDRRRAA